MSIDKIERHIAAAELALANAREEIHDLRQERPKTEHGYETKVEKCPHPKNKVEEVTTMGSGSRKFYCHECEQELVREDL